MTRKRPKPKERLSRIETNRKERKDHCKQLERMVREHNKGNRETEE